MSFGVERGEYQKCWARAGARTSDTPSHNDATPLREHESRDSQAAVSSNLELCPIPRSWLSDPADTKESLSIDLKSFEYQSL
jgi:hypothetical protein